MIGYTELMNGELYFDLLFNKWSGVQHASYPQTKRGTIIPDPGVPSRNASDFVSYIRYYTWSHWSCNVSGLNIGDPMPKEPVTFTGQWTSNDVPKTQWTCTFYYTNTMNNQASKSYDYYEGQTISAPSLSGRKYGGHETHWEYSNGDWAYPGFDKMPDGNVSIYEVYDG